MMRCVLKSSRCRVYECRTDLDARATERLLRERGVEASAHDDHVVVVTALGRQVFVAERAWDQGGSSKIISKTVA